MKTNLRITLLGLYFIFSIVLILAEPVGSIAPLYRIAYDVFAIANLFNVVRLLRKPSRHVNA